MSAKQITLGAQLSLHHQDEATYCGAACAQMIISVPQPSGAVAPLVDQSVIDQDYPSPSSWAMSPEDLAVTINTYRVGQPCFMHRRFGSRVAAMRAIARSVHTFGLPAAALVDAGRHWVVVKELGGTFDKDERPELQPVITSVGVLDPAPDLDLLRQLNLSSQPLPPPHGSPDICPNLQSSEEWYSWSGWEDRFSRCPVSGPWDDGWIVVCAPWDKPCDMSPKIPLSALPAGSSGDRGADEGTAGRPVDLENIDAIAGWANAECSRLGLGKRSSLMDVLAPGCRGEVHVVHRLDSESSYVLVVLTRGDRPPAVLRFDSTTWALQHVAVGNSRVVRQNLALITPHSKRLVWQPGAESPSPFCPIGELAEGGGYLLFGRRLESIGRTRRAWSQSE